MMPTTYEVSTEIAVKDCAKHFAVYQRSIENSATDFWKKKPSPHVSAYINGMLAVLRRQLIQARQSANGGSIRDPGVEWDCVKIHNRRGITALAPPEPPRKILSSLNYNIVRREKSQVISFHILSFLLH